MSCRPDRVDRSAETVEAALDVNLLAELVADRIEARLAGRLRLDDQRPALVDAAELAAELGVDRDFVYRHADLLGALTIGDGPKPRLRFDPVKARAALACSSSRRSEPPRADNGGAIRTSRSSKTGASPFHAPKPGSILRNRGRRGRDEGGDDAAK